MKRLSVGFGLLGAALGSWAQAEGLANQETETLETVQVWATEVRASSVEMDEEAISTKQADHISDLLRPVPGVDVGGSHSLNQRITIRSMDDKDLRITIDGANQNTYMYHHMGNLQINANILKSVDVEVGNNSVINGGLGGVVRFRTKEAKDMLQPGQQIGGHWQYTYADNASESRSATAYAQLTDQVDVLGYFNTLDRGNFEVGGGEIKDADGNEVPGTDGTVRGLEGTLNDSLVKFGWDITPNQRVAASYEAYRDQGDYSFRPDMGLATDLAIAEGTNTPLIFPTEFTRDTLTLTHDISLGDHSEIKTSLFQNISEFRRDETGLADSTNGGIASSAGLKRAEATNTGLNVLAETWLSGGLEQELTWGLDAIKYETDYNQVLVSGAASDYQQEAESAALFLQDRFVLSSGFSVTPGVRYEHYDVATHTVDNSFSEWLGALAGEYEWDNRLLLRVSSTQLFKGPELWEAYIPPSAGNQPNEDIKAETGVNNEFSIAFKDQMLGLDQFKTGVTLFQTNIDDYIYDYAPTGVPRVSRQDNIGDMTIKGFEAYVGVDQGAFNVLMTYARAESELDAVAQYSQLDGARIDREQGDSVSILVDYLVASMDLSLHWDVLMVDDLDDGIDLDGAGANRAKDGYIVHNISARWTPASVEGLSVTVGVDNLFDEFYASQSSRTGVTGHPVFGDLYLLDYEPGRNVKATVAFQF